MKVDELRQQAKARGVRRYSKLNKRELISALRDGGTSGDQRTEGKRYAQSIDSTGQHEDRPGRTLVTRNHDVIRQWADARRAQAATVPGTEHGDHLGVLRLDFPGYGGSDLRHVSWDEWFATFDNRGVQFVYQEHTADGGDSNFFRLDNPEREDA
jgi:hypothetical protein